MPYSNKKKIFLRIASAYNHYLQPKIEFETMFANGKNPVFYSITLHSPA